MCLPSRKTYEPSDGLSRPASCDLQLRLNWSGSFYGGVGGDSGITIIMIMMIMMYSVG